MCRIRERSGERAQPVTRIIVGVDRQAMRLIVWISHII